MRECIYTIPLNDIFEVEDGCPLCRMRRLLENRCVEYIMGAAMMEPDVRIETNRYGFCQEHFSVMLKQKNRLSLALMIETHLDELIDRCIPFSQKKGEISPAKTCFVCREIESAMKKLLENAARTAANDAAFASLLSNQPYYCFSHYEMFCDVLRGSLPKKNAGRLIAQLTECERQYFQSLRKDVHDFTTTFDYRSTQDLRNESRVKTAVERAVQALK